MLNDVEAKPRRQVCIQRSALQLNRVPAIEMILTTAHGLGRNRTSNNRDSKYRDSVVFGRVSA